MARWTFAAGDWDDPERRLLDQPQARSLKFRRREGSTLEFNLDGRGPDASRITDLVTDLYAWRDDEPMFRGRVAPMADEVTTDDHDTKVTAADYREVLTRRFIIEGDAALETPYTLDVGVLALALVQITQAKPAGYLGITYGLGIPAGRIISGFEIKAGQSIKALIDVMADTDAATTGFDWEIDALRVLNIYPGGRGGASGETLQYGDRVTKVSRTGDPSLFANVLRGNGSSDSGIARTVAVPGLTGRPEGRWEAQVGFTEINSYPVLTRLVTQELRQRAVMRPSYVVELEPGWWRGPDHLWLGDTARLLVDSGRLAIDETLKIETVNVTVSEEGDERVSLEMASTFPGFARRFLKLEDRVTRLERN